MRRPEVDAQVMASLVALLVALVVALLMALVVAGCHGRECRPLVEGFFAVLPSGSRPPELDGPPGGPSDSPLGGSADADGMLLNMPIGVGEQAPNFALKDQNNQVVRLSDFRGRKNVLLVFYPLAFTGTCQGELCQLRDNLGDFASDTVEVLTVSVDSPYAHKVWAEREGYEFPMLADFWPHGAVAQAYGVFNESIGFANRGTFVIDRDGAVRFSEMNGPGQARDQEAWRKALAELA